MNNILVYTIQIRFSKKGIKNGVWSMKKISQYNNSSQFSLTTVFGKWFNIRLKTRKLGLKCCLKNFFSYNFRKNTFWISKCSNRSTNGDLSLLNFLNNLLSNQYRMRQKKLLSRIFRIIRHKKCIMIMIILKKMSPTIL